MKFSCILIIFNCFSAIVITAQGPPCTTPNDEKASCVSLFDCPVLLTASSNKDSISRAFLLASACGDEKFTVCCGSAPSYTKIPSSLPPSVLANLPKDIPPGILALIPSLGTSNNDEKIKFESLSKDERKKYATEKLLPGKTYCGLQHTDDYFYNSTETSVDEFPWMALIPVKINPGIVILGLHHIYKDVSCIGTTFGIDDCTTTSLTELIEGSATYEGGNFQLLRLVRKIAYSDFVRPICLPIEDSELPKPGDSVLTSGWGEEEITEFKDVTVKKRIQHTLIIKRECELGNPVSNPICGVTFWNSTRYVCPGDNGGPLMYRLEKDNKNWVALGIVIETSSCIKYQPVVAEKITTEALDWILDNIKP